MRYPWDHDHWSGDRTATAADGNLRASDAERNEVAEKLSRHFAEGRLDEPELQLRLGRAMGATRRGELGGLFDDLPRLDDEPAPQPAAQRRLWPALVWVAVTIAALCVALSVLGTVASWFHAPLLLVCLVVVFLWVRAHRHSSPHRALGERRDRPPLGHHGSFHHGGSVHHGGGRGGRLNR